MPRIRSIKPQHWEDKFLPKISIGAHLLWIGMWNFSDDKGIIERDYHLIKSYVFPRRKDIKPLHVEKWIKELIKFKFVIPFEHEDIQYVIHRTFDVHQKIDKPQKSKINDDVIKKVFDDCSANGCGIKEEQSSNDSRKERRGEEGIGEEKDSGFNDKKFLVPEMQQIWKKHKPDYPEDKIKDFTAIQSIAVFISQQSGIDYHKRKNGDEKNIYDLWGTISEFVSKHDFFKNYSLHQVEKHIQSITQEIKNGSSKNGKTGTSKVNGQQLNTAFTDFYSQAK